MKTSIAGINLIKEFEGLRLVSYQCPAKVWTIGWGTTVYPNGQPVKAGQTITKEQAEEYLINDLKRFEAAVNKYAAKYNWNQNQFDALVSFTYNLGTGSIDQVTINGARDIKTISEKMILYNKAGGVVLNGLVRRRAAEQKLFLTPVSQTPQTVNPPIRLEGSDIQRFIVDMRNALKLANTASAQTIFDNTPTVSAKTNRRHACVAPIQILLQTLGYYTGKIDQDFGPLSEGATKAYQKDIVGLQTPDGIWSKKGRSFRKSLGI